MLRTLSILLLLFLFAQPILAQTRPDYVVAVLRGDGIVEPFATMHDSTWQTVSNRDLNYLAWKQPKFYFYSDTGDIETLYIGTKVIFDPDGMNSGEGFISSYSAASPGHNCCYPKSKAGIALNWQSEQAMFVKADSSQQVNVAANTKLNTLFRNAEQALIDGSQQFEINGILYSYAGIPVSRSLRDSLTISIQYQVTDKPILGKKFVLFKATRAYPSTGCGPNTGNLQGWAVLKGGRVDILNHAFSVGDCDGKGLDAFIDPYIAFELKGKVYIATVLTYYEGEGRQLLEVAKDEIWPVLDNH